MAYSIHVGFNQTFQPKVITMKKILVLIILIIACHTKEKGLTNSDRQKLKSITFVIDSSNKSKVDNSKSLNESIFK
jgi:hypothetical protein